MIKELVSLRKKAGFKQEDMAEVLGLDQPDISKIEQHVRKLDALELIDWLEATGGNIVRVLSKL